MKTIIGNIIIWSIIFVGTTYSQNNIFGIHSDEYVNPQIKPDKNMKLYIWESTCMIGPSNTKGLKGEYLKVIYEYSKSQKTWFGFGEAVFPEGNIKDMSKFRNGILGVSVRVIRGSSKDLYIGIKTGTTTDAWIGNLKNYGLVDDGKWHSLKIPISAFIEINKDFIDLSNLTQYFMLKGEYRQGATPEKVVIDIDEIYWKK